MHLSLANLTNGISQAGTREPGTSRGLTAGTQAFALSGDKEPPQQAFIAVYEDLTAGHAPHSEILETQPVAGTLSIEEHQADTPVIGADKSAKGAQHSSGDGDLENTIQKDQDIAHQDEPETTHTSEHDEDRFDLDGRDEKLPVGLPHPKMPEHQDKLVLPDPGKLTAADVPRSGLARMPTHTGTDPARVLLRSAQQRIEAAPDGVPGAEAHGLGPIAHDDLPKQHGVAPAISQARTSGENPRVMVGDANLIDTTLPSRGNSLTFVAEQASPRTGEEQAMNRRSLVESEQRESVRFTPPLNRPIESNAAQQGVPGARSLNVTGEKTRRSQSTLPGTSDVSLDANHRSRQSVNQVAFVANSFKTGALPNGLNVVAMRPAAEHTLDGGKPGQKPAIPSQTLPLAQHDGLPAKQLEMPDLGLKSPPKVAAIHPAHLPGETVKDTHQRAQKSVPLTEAIANKTDSLTEYTARVSQPESNLTKSIKPGSVAPQSGKVENERGGASHGRQDIETRIEGQKISNSMGTSAVSQTLHTATPNIENTGPDAGLISKTNIAVQRQPSGFEQEERRVSSAIESIASEVAPHAPGSASGAQFTGGMPAAHASAPQVSAQISGSIRALFKEKHVELVLAPKELGHVKLTLSGGDGTVTVHVSTERPETMDLLRRQAVFLEQEFRDIGYQNTQFNFDQRHSGSGNSETMSATQPEQGQGATESASIETANSIGQPASDRMDIRI